MRKFQTKLFLLMLLSSTVFWSWGEDEEDPQQLTESLTVENAKQWYETNVINKNCFNSFKSKTSDSTVFDLKPLLNWDLAELDNDSIWSVVELPWQFENGGITLSTTEVKSFATNNTVEIKNVYKLVVVKNRITNEVFGFKMAIIPDLEYMLEKGDDINMNKYLKRDNDLNGVVMFYNLNDEFVNGWKYKTGKVISKLVKADSSSSSNINGIFKTSAGYEYYTIETCYYFYTIVNGVKGPTQFNGCKSRDYVELVVDENKLDQNSTGSGYYDSSNNGGSTEDEPEKPKDCNRVAGGTAYLDECGECVGGNTGKVACKPCPEIEKIKNDAALIKRIKAYIIKAINDQLEDGYMKKSDGSLLEPTIREVGKVNYSYNSTDKFSERIHTHTDISGGTYIFSAKDISTLFSMFINNRMVNVNEFKYIVVSSFGIGVLNITDTAAFQKFGEGNIIDKINKQYQITERVGNDIPDHLKQFLEVLNNLNSGLTFTVGEFDSESSNPNIEWNTKQLDFTGSVNNKDCN